MPPLQLLGPADSGRKNIPRSEQKYYSLMASVHLNSQLRHGKTDDLSVIASLTIWDLVPNQNQQIYQEGLKTSAENTRTAQTHSQHATPPAKQALMAYRTVHFKVIQNCLMKSNWQQSNLDMTNAWWIPSSLHGQKKVACAEKAAPLLTAASKANKLFKAQNEKCMVSSTATPAPKSPSMWSEFRSV